MIFQSFNYLNNVYLNNKQYYSIIMDKIRYKPLQIYEHLFSNSPFTSFYLVSEVTYIFEPSLQKTTSAL